MSTRTVFYARRFLNRPRHHLGAHVIATVDLESFDDGVPFVDARLHLSDCAHHVTLDFSAYDRRDAHNALRKVAVLRSVLADYEDGLRRAVAEAGLAPRA
ncbi:MAG: hypothetical protein ABJA74_11410 [Lapillicoccus sp.]